MMFVGRTVPLSISVKISTYISNLDLLGILIFNPFYVFI